MESLIRMPAFLVGRRPGRLLRLGMRAAAVGLIVLAAVLQPESGIQPASRIAAARGMATYADYAQDAVMTLERSWLAGNAWRMCLLRGCKVTNQDWGADALTYDLALRWQTTHDPSLVAYLDRLSASAHDYRPCHGSSCDQWSDVPVWDSIAASREYEATGNGIALARAEHAFAAVQDASAYYALGACPDVRYQQAFGGTKRLKTLETDGNYVRAALLLYGATRDGSYLVDAKLTYAAIRARFLDPQAPLYTVYLFDDGTQCVQVPHRFFASVNGTMILNGLLLTQATGDRSYQDEALATARAVAQDLADGHGVYADLQAENDIGEPLVEGMYDVATLAGQPFARAWLLRNAAAAISARTPAGYGRFFDGPAPRNPLTAWQTSGGFALMMAAAALDPNGRPAATNAWAGAQYVSHEIATLPATLTFSGSGIALIGAIGDRCCEPGHARVIVDGRETLDQTGIWQNKSSSGRRLPDAVLFAWRWPASGRHTLTLLPAAPNAKEGGTFLHVVGYDVIGGLRR